MAKRILLADDSITIQKVITITFASEDYELTVVGDGDSAIARARQIKPDLIMADVAMPGKNGYEVCETIKNDPALKNTPVLLLAGTFEPLNKDEALRVKADDSIVKPFESQDMLDRVGELLLKASRIEGTAEAEDMPVFHPKAARPELGISNEPWAEGDFLGFPEAFEETTETGQSLPPDLDFLEGGLFEESEKPSVPPPEKQEFTDLEFAEEELVREKPKAASTAAETKETPHEFPGIEPIESFNAEPSKPSASPRGEPSPQKEAPFELGGFPPEPFKTEAKAPWEAPAREEAAKEWPEAEPDLLEAPEATITEERAPGPVTPREPIRPERGAEALPLRQIRPVELPVAEIVEKAAAEVADRARAEISAMVPSIVASALPKEKVDETLRKTAEEAVKRAVEDAVNKAAAEAVDKTAREIIEKIAWDVVPELAEELITAELNKIREAFSKLK